MKQFENSHILFFYIFCYCEMRTWVVQSSLRLTDSFFIIIFKMN